MQEEKTHRQQIIDLQILKSEGRLNGEFKDIPNEVYHDPDCPALSRSAIIMARGSLAVYKAYKNGLRKDPSAAMEFGSLFHEFILEPDLFNSKYIAPYPVPRPEGNATKKKENGGCKEDYTKWKNDKTDYLLDGGGRAECESKDWSRLHGMKASMNEIEIINVILNDKDTEFENSYFFTDKKTGQLCKFRPDIINKRLRVMVDLKSCIDASPLGFGKAMAKSYTDVQGALYLRGAEELFGEKWQFGYFAVENVAPYLVGLHSLGEAEREVGETILNEGLARISGMPKLEDIKNCYSERFSDCALPAWAYGVGYR